MHTLLMALPFLLSVACGAPSPTLPDPATPQTASAIRVVRPLPEAALPDVAERAVRSVVNISTTRTVRFDPGERLGPFFDDPFFREFFGPGLPRIPRERRERSLGSGVLVSADGVVLTNNHVVGGAETIEVTLYGGRTVSATVVGADRRSDVAVIQLDDPPDDLEPLPMGDAAALRLGELVLAIGNPFGVGHTVTMGIVSAKGRALGIVDYEDFIQTDAAINPGNSGGPLVNLRGELVGINTAIATRSGGYQGVGFAIPSELALDIMDRLIAHGQVVRGWLGVVIQALEPELAEALGVPVDGGVLVSDVVPGSPAAKVGLRRADVIVAFNGEPMMRPAELRMAVASAGPDTRFTVEVLRDARRQTLTGKLGTLEDDETAPGEPEQVPRDGLVVGPLTPQVRRDLGVPERFDGVQVVRVEPGGAAERAGLREGDILLEADRHPVTSPDALRRILRDGGPSVLLLLWRGGGTHFVVLER